VDLSETEILNTLASGQESPRQQERLLLELRNVGTAASIPVLRSKVDATDVRVRVAALRALAVVEGAGAVDCLIQALKQDDATTTKWAAQLINQKVGLEPEAVPDLIAVADERWDAPSVLNV
jgi:HEAT repeat protein